MNIVVLDGYTLNPGDLSWEQLEQLGDCRIYDRTAPEKVVERARRAEILLTNKTPVTAADMEQLPNLKYIGVLATGYNIVDVEAAKERNIVVTNVPTYGTDSVAQHTFAHILNLTNRVGEHAQSVTRGDWTMSPDWCYWNYPLIELRDLTIGIVGFGRIGKAVARLANAFGMKVLFHDPTPPPDAENGEPADLDKLFRESDIVSLHCPLSDENEKFVNKERLASMKKSAFLINTSRGQLVDEDALADALNSSGIAGAGLDVLSLEPPPADHPLLTAKNCFITPHNAWATKASRTRLMNIVIENIQAFLNGRPQNVVSQ